MILIKKIKILIFDSITNYFKTNNNKVIINNNNISNNISHSDKVIMSIISDLKQDYLQNVEIYIYPISDNFGDVKYITLIEKINQVLNQNMYYDLVCMPFSIANYSNIVYTELRLLTEKLLEISGIIIATAYGKSNIECIPAIYKNVLGIGHTFSGDSVIQKNNDKINYKVKSDGINLKFSNSDVFFIGTSLSLALFVNRIIKYLIDKNVVLQKRNSFFKKILKGDLNDGFFL